MAITPSAAGGNARIDRRISPPIRKPLCLQIDFSILGIFRDLSTDPIREIDSLVGTSQFNLGNDNPLKQSAINIDRPGCAAMSDKISDLIEDMPGAHRPHDGLSVGQWDWVLKLESAEAGLGALQNDGGRRVRYSHANLLPTGAGDKPIANSDTADDGIFPAVIRDKELAFYFHRHVSLAAFRQFRSTILRVADADLMRINGKSARCCGTPSETFG